MLYEKQLGLLRGISHSPRCCWRVKSFLFSFCVYMIKSDDTLIDIQFRQPGETVMRMLMHQFKLTKELNLFFITWLCLVWRDGTDFTLTQKYVILLLSQPTYRHLFFHIKTQLESIRHLKNFLYTSHIFSVLS